MLRAQTLAFNEDVQALERLTHMHETEDAALFYEMNIPSDRAGLEMRRRLKSLADAETAAMTRRES
jgi:vanillate O-demethylase monooxygenase subunit